MWNARTGQFVREFCGTTWYAAVGAYVNRLNPRQAFVMGNTCELDWEKGLWRVTGTLSRPTCPESLFGLDREGLKMEVVRHEGRDLLIATGERLLTCIAELGPSAPNPWRPWAPSPLSGDSGYAWPDLVLKHLTDDAGRSSRN